MLLVEVLHRGKAFKNEEYREDLESGDQERQLQGVDRIIQLWTLTNSDGEFRIK